MSETTTETTDTGTAPVTTPVVPAAESTDTADTGAATLAAALRENAILKAGVTLDSDAGKLLVANPTVDIASVVALAKPAGPVVPDANGVNAANAAAAQAAQLALLQADGSAAAATAARTALAAGGTGDVGAPDVHPHVLAKNAINDGLTKQHLSHTESVALGVAQIMNAGIRGDVRANYTGQSAPGV